MITAFRSGANKSSRSPRTLAFSVLALILSALAGCANTTKPVVGPVEFTDISGASVPAVTSLTASGHVYLVATVTNDDEALGVSWTVACGSSVPPSGTGGGTIATACGVCSPAQTASGPVPLYPSTGIVTTYTAPSVIPDGNTVTITAHATSMPSVTSSITLTVVAAQAANPAMARRRRRHGRYTGRGNVGPGAGGELRRTRESRRKAMTRTSNQEIGVSGEPSTFPQTGARPGADRPANYRAGTAASRRRFGYLPGRAALPNVFFVFFFCWVVLAVCGCSAPTKPQLGAISVTDPGGTSQTQTTSVIVNASVDVSVTVDNDGANLGVDWSLLCGGSPIASYTTNVCGTITPVHVGSNINMVYLAPAYVPVGNTATLTATLTSDPSRSASVTLTILPQPVTIQFTQGFLPPAAMAASATTQLAATVTNDPTAAGVNWKIACGSGFCGSLSAALTASGNSSTVYTAPAAIPGGGTVKVTATSVFDPAKSISATIAIMPVAVTVLPQSITLPPSTPDLPATVALTATVAYDAFNAGVDWSPPVCATAGACGAIAPLHTASGVAATYTAPQAIPTGGTVTVTAKSTTDPTATATVNITIGTPPPIGVSVAPATGSAQLGGSAALTATVTDDFTNRGVTWQCSPGSCYPATSTVQPYRTTYTAPLVAPPSNTATATATSIADPTKSGAATITIVPQISVALTTHPITAGVPATFIATVSNDIAPGGVDWTATGCLSSNCGTFDSGNPGAPNHSASGANITYTAPKEIPWPATNATVTITATSTASETAAPVRSASAHVSVTPVPYVRFVPFAPSALPLGNPSASAPALVNLIAVAANDATNAGVDWTVSCSDASASACGQFLHTPEMVATTTTADIPATYWPYATKVHAASGQTVSYQPPTQLPTGGAVTFTVTSTASPSASATQAVNISSNTSGLNGVALSGTVRAGNLPVSGAAVELFAAGNTGYGSVASPLVISNGGYSVTTASDGSFAIPAGYTCPSMYSLLFLVATGGTPQDAAHANSQLGLMTALGPCSGLNNSVPLIVNEVTAVASVYALAPFAGADYAHIGSSSSNYNNGPNLSNATNYNNGLANAFATVNNLVDVTTGQALSVPPPAMAWRRRRRSTPWPTPSIPARLPQGVRRETAALATPISRHRMSTPSVEAFQPRATRRPVFSRPCWKWPKSRAQTG